MRSPNSVVYRNLDASDALTETINQKFNRLNRFARHIQHGRVVLDSPHKHHYKGRQYRASIELEVEGQPITVSQDKPSIHIAVRDAFNAAERKLKALGAKRHIH
ncbi:HPF/RaiA family ribosome-associated protein [Aurantivibrio plasticivorans]